MLLRHEGGCCGQVGAVQGGALVAQQTKVGRDPFRGVGRVAREAEAPITMRTSRRTESTDVEVAVVDGGGTSSRSASRDLNSVVQRLVQHVGDGGR